MQSSPHPDHALIAGATGRAGALLRRLPAPCRRTAPPARRPAPPVVSAVDGLLRQQVDFDRRPGRLEGAGAACIAHATTIRASGAEALRQADLAASAGVQRLSSAQMQALRPAHVDVPALAGTAPPPP